MSNWIKKMNEMLAENCYTDAGRVTVDYCENANKIMITVLNRTCVLNTGGYTDYGLMMKCMEIIKMLYD